MAPDMLYHLQRLAGAYVNKVVLCLSGYLVTEFVDYITGMRYCFRDFESATGGPVQIFTGALKRFREMLPCLKDLSIDAK